ncbi:MAG: DUF2608 domain-containing protein [Oligoflexia bacterium]|nr:DUF2608 domain-containing protein [Oligoflexia bacterium]
MRFSTSIIFLLGFVLCFGRPSFAKIEEIKSMRDIESAITDDTLVVLDIDNTIIHPTTYLGSDEWHYYLYRIYKINGVDEKEILSKTTDVWNKTQSLIEIELAEKGTPDLIKKLQGRGIKIMSLTARDGAIADLTIKHLKSLGVDFSKSSLLEADKELPWPEGGVLVRGGIIFVGENNVKGKVLSQFLQKIKFIPRKVVFVDDRQKHVRSVDKEMGDLGVPCVSFRYGALDERVKSFEAFFSLFSESGPKDKWMADLFLLGQIKK